MKLKIPAIVTGLTLLISVISCQKEASPVISIIPQPLKVIQTTGVFHLTARVKILVKDEAALASQAAFLKNRIISATGFQTEVVKESSGKVISLQIETGLEGTLGTEGYALSVTKSDVEILAATPAGIFYGIQTLLQLLPPDIYADKVIEGIKWNIPCVQITDKPRFVWRGFLLDVSRHFFPASYIYDVLDYMAVHKLNRFQMHLTDDQGWRVEIKKYPKLTEVGAWRVNQEDRHWNSREKQKPGEKATYGGFYTQDDIRKFVTYAARRNITIIPEIEMPAHATSSLASYPENSCTGDPLTVLPGGIWPCINIYCAGKEETFTFLQDVLTEVIALFPSEYIHIGGDEADKSQWVKCPACQKRIKVEGLKDEKELQSYFIQRIEKFLNSQGRKLIGWDEILEGGLAPNAAVMSWRGTQGGIDAAKAGHPVVMTPTSHCYFDYYQGNPESEPLAIGGFLPLEKVYAFDPVPQGLNADEAKMILGAQANLWTEYISDSSHADYMTFPRLTALSELCWTSPGHKNFDDFSIRLVQQLKRFNAIGINYSKSFSSVDIVTGFNPEKNQIEVTLKSGFPGTEIRYTSDGNDPVQSTQIYTGPILVNQTTVIKAVAFLNGKPLLSVSERKIMVHLATGKTVTYTNPYSDKYTGGGKFALVNGIRGTINLSDGNWQGIEGGDLNATIDLGSVQTIKKLTVGALQSIGSWIFFPTQVDFWLSIDGKTFNGAGNVKNMIDLKDANRQIQNFSVEISPTQARYVNVIARTVRSCPSWHAGKGNPAWLFVDEIIVE
ncbi:MAG: glycoside hydrolase family 20 protein [Bacteroidia bacterium]|nr:glycoside hydrolase family 20 protein [Bacteroidia bacterium]